MSKIRRDLKTQQEAAMYANVAPRTIRRWEREGLIQRENGVFYDKAQLDAAKNRPQPNRFKDFEARLMEFQMNINEEIDQLLVELRAKFIR